VINEFGEISLGSCARGSIAEDIVDPSHGFDGGRNLKARNCRQHDMIQFFTRDSFKDCAAAANELLPPQRARLQARA
jgi:hypothetical protein